MNDGDVIVFPSARLLKAIEVAEILNISRAYAYRLMQQGQIRTVKIGYSRRVRPEDLMLFIENNMSPQISTNL